MLVIGMINSTRLGLLWSCCESSIENPQSHIFNKRDRFSLKIFKCNLYCPSTVKTLEIVEELFCQQAFAERCLW